MRDIFENKILCEKCERVMRKVQILKDGFVLRAVECPECHEKIVHPSDLSEYNQFNELKRKSFKVKLRIVGNSYAVSIPKEIVEFMKEQEKIMDNMVRLVFDDAKRLMLNFGESDEDK